MPFLAEAGLVDDPITRRPAPAARRRDAAGARADQQAHRGRADARVPVRRRGRRSAGPTRSTTPAATSCARAYDALAALGEWTTAAIEAALRAALVEGLGLKPRNAFGPVRVAVTGSRVSPPLFESLELLGRERLARPPAVGADMTRPGSTWLRGPVASDGLAYHRIQRGRPPRRLAAARRHRR